MSAPADPNLMNKWEMILTRDIDGGTFKFFLRISKQEKGRLEGFILKTDGSDGAPLRGFYIVGPVTSPFSMGLRLNIDGVIIVLSGLGIQTTSTAFAQMDGPYFRLGRESFATAAFDPGETGSGAGSQTT